MRPRRTPDMLHHLLEQALGACPDLPACIVTRDNKKGVHGAATAVNMPDAGAIFRQADVAGVENLRHAVAAGFQPQLAARLFAV